MCHQAEIILADFTNRKYIAEVPDDEQLAFIDYCAAVLAGEVALYSPDESPFQIVTLSTEQLYRSGWRVKREWQNRYGNHWILLTPERRIWSGIDNIHNQSKAWRRLACTVSFKVSND
jgi:hypothetical protein